MSIGSAALTFGISWSMLFIDMYAHVLHVGCFKICMTALGLDYMGIHATEPLPYGHFRLFLSLMTSSGFLSLPLT